MSRLELLLVVGLTLVAGGLPLVLRADGLGGGDPGLGQLYRATGLGLAILGLPALYVAVWGGPPAAGGGAGRRFG